MKYLTRALFWLAIVSIGLSGCERNNKTDPKSEPSNTASAVQDPAAETFTTNCDSRLKLAKEQLAILESYRDNYAADAVLNKINDLDITLDAAASKASLYRNVHPNENVRKAADQCQQQFAKLFTEISLSRPLYNLLQKIDASGADKITKRYIDKMIQDFKRSGVNKDEATRDKIRLLNEEIVKLGQDFNRNIREDVRHIELASADELSGLPEDYIQAHPADGNGKIKITTDYPDYFPFLRYAHNDARRLELYIQFQKRGYPANKNILKELLRKRYELAKLLDYDSYASLITEDKMIKTAGNAQDFIDKINTIAQQRAAQDYAVLLKGLRKTDPSANEVGDWQKMYLEELVKQEQYQIDSRQVRQYFAYDKVRDGIFHLIENMFNVSIKPWQNAAPWHSSVESYEVWDNNRLIGRFYLDMHPRQGKYKHAAQFGVQEGVKDRQIPIAALVCNFPGGDNDEGLMEHAQVETFLHEFGHLIHTIFAGQQQWLGVSGISTEWDFVEAPSQMLEEWIWNPATLKTFAANSDGETIPDDIITKMRAARDFGRGLWARHQMFYAALSLNYYNRDPDSFDLDELMISLRKQYSPYPHVNDTHFYSAFGHLDGYSAIYYTYMWSLVIAADMFSEFEKHGLLNQETAARYRQKVLAPGGSKDAAELVEDFLGRPYNFDAFAAQLNR